MAMVPFARCAPAAIDRGRIPISDQDQKKKGGAVVIARSAGWIGRSSINGVARVLGRCGFAMIGALCALFVADDMARSDIDVFDSSVFFLGMMLSGIAGFYLGLDVPAAVRRVRAAT